MIHRNDILPCEYAYLYIYNFCLTFFTFSISFSFFLQRLSERAFDGLNNLRSLNLKNNKLTALEGGVFTGVPALTNLNLNNNFLETLTYNNILPLMDNLVNHTTVLSVSGKYKQKTIYRLV